MKNTTMATVNRIHSSLEDDADIEVFEINATQSLNYALVLEKDLKSTNMKNVILPELQIIESKSLNKGRFPKNSNHIFQDTEVLEINVTQPLNYASVLEKDFKSINMKNVISPEIEIIESKALNKARFSRNKNHTSQDAIWEKVNDFFGSPHHSNHNKRDKTITHSSKSVQGKKASDQTHGIKRKRKSYVNYSAASIQDFKFETLDMPLKENSYVNDKKCISDESTSKAISGVKSEYKFSKEKDIFKAQHPKEISNTASKLEDGQSDSLYVKDYKIKKRKMDSMQKENSLSIEKYVPDKNYLCPVSLYQPHGEYSNKVKALKSQNSNKIVSESQNMKQNIYSSVNAFIETNYNFDVKYKYWRTTRMQTLQKLKKLVRDLHDDQLAYNKAQKTCRKIGCISRVAKPTPSTLGFITSVSAFLSDTVSGITSAVQAVNVDTYSNKFEEIMNLDTEATKNLYNARSRCLVEYRGIEEVMRMYHSPTFNSTVSKISNDLVDVKNFWMDVSNAYENKDASKMLSVVGKFLESGSQLKVLQKIGDSIVTYVAENPAVLEVCNSVRRAACGAIDSLFIRKRQATLLSIKAHASNQSMILDDKKEINRLSYIIDNDSSQTKLEDKIHDAIDCLKFEMEQITDAYIQQLSISSTYLL